MKKFHEEKKKEEKLTIKAPSGLVHLRDQSEQGHATAVKKLFDYECTELSPEDLKELQERNTPMSPRKVEEQPYFRKHFHVQCCPQCYQRIEKQWNFCPKCGQMIRRQE